jgi:large subunit ribosomal protein L25
VDLYRIAMDVRMRVMVPVHTFGEPQGVKMQGGVFETVTREVEIECLPADIPEEFRVDVTEMLIGKQLRAADLPFDPTKIKLLTDPVRVIAHVVVLKKEEEPAPDAAVTAEAAPAEPEVMKKGKKEVEGEEGEAAEAPAAKAEKSEKKK